MFDSDFKQRSNSQNFSELSSHGRLSKISVLLDIVT